jgi:hypothetical protein
LHRQPTCAGFLLSGDGFQPSLAGAARTRNRHEPGFSYQAMGFNHRIAIAGLEQCGGYRVSCSHITHSMTASKNKTFFD